MDELERFLQNRKDKAGLEQQLKNNIGRHQPQLQALLRDVSGASVYEEGVYRFYHQSFKVFRMQRETERMVALLRQLLPNRPLNDWFQQIVREGTGKQFDGSQNDNWLPVARPILEAFFHAKFFLEIATKPNEVEQVNFSSGKEQVPVAGNIITSRWAALLSLYGIR